MARTPADIAPLLRLPASAQFRVFGAAREALLAWFAALACRTSCRTVLVSAQICPVVPAIIRHCGFHPWFVDLDGIHPGPSAAQFEAAAGDVASDHAATLVAPFYGYLPPTLASLVPTNGAALVLDLAQGFGLAESLSPLACRAAATIYSFGLGKGVDTGGGLLACPAGASFEAVDGAAQVCLPDPWTLAQGALLRSVALLGAHRLLLPLINRATAEAGQLSWEGSTAPSGCPLSCRLARLWCSGVTRLLAEIELARVRAAELFAMPAVVAACRHPEVYGSPVHAHLRQVLRLRDAGRRPTVLERLRRAGVDALPAGEPLPGSYLSDAPSDQAFPNADAFRRDALRLPFLGRLSPAEFTRLASALERSLADDL